MCNLCVLLGSTSQRILNIFSQNLDNCHVFSMISLQFSFIDNHSLNQNKRIPQFVGTFCKDVMDNKEERGRVSVISMCVCVMVTSTKRSNLTVSVINIFYGSKNLWELLQHFH